MKKNILLIVLSLFLFACSTYNPKNDVNKEENKMTFEPNEDGEYDLVVFDPQYEVYLKSIARPQSYYSYDYYKTKNRFYVITWNQRHLNPMQYNPDLYAVRIDLDPNIDYGLEFEYKLFNFFRFIEWKYRIRLM